jgi:hypothetical protein
VAVGAASLPAVSHRTIAARSCSARMMVGSLAYQCQFGAGQGALATGVRRGAGVSLECIGENPRGLEAQTPRSTSAATGRQRPDRGKLMAPITQFQRLARWAAAD